jgi:hypothetical protein
MMASRSKKHSSTTTNLHGETSAVDVYVEDHLQELCQILRPAMSTYINAYLSQEITTLELAAALLNTVEGTVEQHFAKISEELQETFQPFQERRPSPKKVIDLTEAAVNCRQCHRDTANLDVFRMKRCSCVSWVSVLNPRVWLSKD